MFRHRFLQRSELPGFSTERDESYFNQFTPSMNEAYYNEAAMKAKERNALPDDAFGIPRLRAYPLTDASHVKSAIRMYHHCKDPKDQKILAANIRKAAKKFNVNIDSFNKRLSESSESPLSISPINEPKMSERTKEQIVAEHMRLNGDFYNNVFYGAEYMKCVKAIRKYSFMEYFYPSFARMEFPIRLKCVCGGLATTDAVEDAYKVIKMRKPMELDFSKPIGFEVMDDRMEEDLTNLIDMDYSSELNWFKVDLSQAKDHILFCLRFYSVLGEIMLDPNFDPDFHLNNSHHAILLDWGQRVQHHYDLYKDAVESGFENEQMYERQFLWDLFWDFNDNPSDPNVQTRNLITMMKFMASVEDQVVNMNESNVTGELVSREKCTSYLVHDLGLPDDIFLVPDKLLYPIVDKNSVKLAMDNIQSIDKEDRDTYAKNLNRKYKEFGCNFSISVDHPFAQYADKAIVLNMTMMLMEGETAVDDEGTSTGAAPEDRLAAPPHKKVEFIRGQYLKNLADDKLTQPNVKSTQVVKDMDDSLN